MVEFHTSARLTVVALSVACMLLLAACTGAGAVSTATPIEADKSGAVGTGILPGYQDQTKLEFSPLIISALEPEVVPVKASDGKYYVAYELSVFNDAPRDATMTKVETIAGDDRGTVIATLDQEHIAANTMMTGGNSSALAETDIPAGRTVIVVFRDAYPTRKAVPATFTHRISATFAPAKPNDPRLASKYPDQVAQIGGYLAVSTETPVVIGPPLAGENWFANNGLESEALNAHSDVVIPVGGRVTSAERFAIDFLRIDPTSMKSYRGDPALNASYLAFDQPLIAVAKATVVKVVSDQPDVTPMVLTEVETVDDVTGNSIVLDLGNGVYALYAHMQQGSAQVKVGDTVKKGQEIGRLGNSGNTSEAHLHFQLQRARSSQPTMWHG
ncbi:M23 family metallopeptidase [Glaciibacter superstes]|uniref:M23 family metallopeptidase n=1 Tax=Glaciibacter superstes TaxID=501023 RepID=UPI000413EAB0|nr:M23 family metallopeptidase [Glaciibacter superstes]